MFMIQEERNPKIYEKLDYRPMPENYNSEVPWIVQQQISATNGVHYGDIVGKLQKYPEYNLPISPAKNGGLSLDIGCGWGRWLVASAKKGYLPIGIDLRLEFCITSRQVLEDFGKSGYTVVADLENIPFVDNIFSFIWSFSVIQHTHHNRLINCLNHINRILNPEGYTMLEFPNKNGLHNRIRNVSNSEKYKDDYNSWCVRYYTPEEYRTIIEKYLDNFTYQNHSFLGIGILKEDLKYVSFKNKLIALISLFGSNITKVIPPLKQLSDSLYIKAEKKENSSDNGSLSNIDLFKKMHALNSKDNLNIVQLLRCPKYGGEVEISTDRKKIISKDAGIYYPIENNIPIMIASEALPL